MGNEYKNGNLSCGGIIFVMALCSFGTYAITYSVGSKEVALPLIVGLFIGYFVASFINSSDMFS